MRVVLVAVLVALGVASVAGQDTGPTFEVASVRPSPPPPPPEITPIVSVSSQPGGRWVAQNATVMRLLRSAYPEFGMEGQIRGGPEWAYRDRFNVEAKAANNAATEDDLRLMVRRLLRERFGLRFHIEQQPLEVHVVTVARQDGKLGPGLSSPAVDCGAVAARIAKEGNQQGLTPAEAACRVRTTQEPTPNGLILHVSGGGLSMTQIVGLLGGFAPAARLTVIDRTGVKEMFDIRFKFEVTPTRPGVSTQTDTSGGTGVPTLFDAAEEQLGLKFERRSEPTDVMVIDSVQQPTEN